MTRIPRPTISEIDVDGVRIFYRQSGSRSAPTLMLLHGLPSSSFMFRDLIPRLADRFFVIAPDYPGFGFSEQPDRTAYSYTFDNIARTIGRFAELLELDRYALYLQDYGGPVGLRLAINHPDRVTAIIAQNIGLYEEGITDAVWEEMRAIWADPTPENREKLRFAFTYDYTKFQWLLGAPDPGAIPPETYTLDYALLQRPGTEDIQVDLLLDYGTELDYYARYQAYLREQEPPLLAVFGAGDSYFPPVTVECLSRDLPSAETHLLPAGHFALETHVDEIAERIRDFLLRRRERLATT